MSAHTADPPLGGTIDHILSLLPSLTPAAQRAAQICVERPGEVAEMSGADLADAAGTSAAAVSRMSQALGFRSFQHLRLTLVRDLGAAAPEGDEDGDDDVSRLRGYAERSARMLQTSLASIDADVFAASAVAIAQAPRLLLAATGASQPSAQAAAVAFTVNGRSCEAPSDTVMQQLTASVLRPGDVCVAVSASGANTNTLAVAQAAAQAGATVVVVTGFARAPLTVVADLVLVAGARSASWEHSAMASGMVQLLVLSALQRAVADRMADAAARARSAVQHEVLGIVADDVEP
ncbi:MurR/RpiR family transcriptional regulator [Microbacterium dextranolyticum]|uniref:MurR/RpiR family transcriptional regulator n=1 Tax=Microbacterium dextranolyticum TaxID=36806 RepID=A0A9W6HJY1_9MICO|nr:SIS domain-containing protein [Microbacterium dextranolyticum]MBM7461895.1 DNA-binding MurR/RpiR family transcriptional regulator [Microbacterium dextranolyticum]GLJ94136.1 hypothetical protein GCM10017591_01970 [Microbacterium dextranolyticum]